MRNVVSNTFIYYNAYWVFMYGMLINKLVGTCLLLVFCYQIFSFKINHLFIERHNVQIVEINQTLDTCVASMENNPLNVIIDVELDESDTEEKVSDEEDDQQQLLK